VDKEKAVHYIACSSADNEEVVEHYAGEGYDAGYAERSEELSRLTAERDAYKAALESLTPGGSEFVNDPEYCRDYVQRKLNSNHESIKRAVKESRALEAQVAEIKELLDAAWKIYLPDGAALMKVGGEWGAYENFESDAWPVSSRHTSPLEAFKAVKKRPSAKLPPAEYVETLP